MSKEKILKKGSEYANKSWNVLGYPKEHDNAREDFIAGALWAVKNCSIPDVSQERELLKKWWKYFYKENVALNCNDEEREEVINDLALSKFPIREYWTSYKLYDENLKDRKVFKMGIKAAIEHLTKPTNDE